MKNRAGIYAESLPKPVLRTDVLEMSDLSEGMELSGTVRNVVDFGAFVEHRGSSGRTCSYFSDKHETH